MAVIDPLKRPPLVDPNRPVSVVRGLPVQAPVVPSVNTRRFPPAAPSYNPIRAGLQDVVNEYQRAGGGPAGVGAATRSVLGQAVDAPVSVGRNALTGVGEAVGIMASPFVQFGRALAGIEPGQPAAAVAPPAALSASRIPPYLQDAAQGLRRASTGAPIGQPAPASSVPPRNLTPDGPPVFSTGNTGFGTAQLGSRAPQRVASNYGAGVTNVVPSYVPPSAYAPQTTAQRPRGAESAALARSREMDAMLRQLVSRVQQEPQSYGELFARKGTLAALGQVGNLAQAAGTNYIQGVGDVLQADTSRYSTDRGFESNLGAQAVQARGQDLTFESNLGQQNVTRESGLLQRLLDEQKLAVDERNSIRQAEAVGGAGAAQAQARLEAAKIRAQATQYSADQRERQALLNAPRAALEMAIANGVTLTGERATPEQLAAMAARYQILKPTPGVFALPP